jgi:GT2 family glycosyltransferase
VTAIVVTYKRPEMLRTTLIGLGDQSRPPTSVLVIDNDPAQTAGPIADEFGHGYLCTSDNLGPAGGIALGVEVVVSDAADDDLVLLVDDDDPLPSADTLERLVDAFGVASRRAGRCAGVGLVGARYRPSRGDFVRVDDDELVGLVPVDYIGGGHAPLYLVRALREVGTFDAALFFGFDDSEFGLRLKRAGWDLYVPGELWHELRRSTGRLAMPATPRIGAAPPAWRQYYSARNAVHLARRYGTKRGLRKTVLRGFVVTPGRRLVHQRSFSVALAAARGTLDGLRGVQGRAVEPT